MKKNVRRLALLVCGAVFLFSSAMMARDLIRSNRERAANQALSKQVRQIRDAMRPPDLNISLPELPAPEEPRDLLAEYAALAQENGDMTGWLWIEGTEIDYPVMHTPRAPEYYLRRGFDKKYALSGSLFLDANCRPEGECALIYGHNMKNGTMFSRLHDYQDPVFAQEHPVIRFDTMTEEREYAVLGAFYSQAYTAQDTGVFRYYQYENLTEPEDFARYVVQVREAALYDTGVEVRYGDRLLVLSTCSYHRKNGRFVVVAVQQAAPEGELDTILP